MGGSTQNRDSIATNACDHFVNHSFYNINNKVGQSLACDLRSLSASVNSKTLQTLTIT